MRPYFPKVKGPAPSPNTVLVALLPTVADWRLARGQGIYRIPVRSAPELVRTGTLTAQPVPP